MATVGVVRNRGRPVEHSTSTEIGSRMETHSDSSSNGNVPTTFER